MSTPTPLNYHAPGHEPNARWTVGTLRYTPARLTNVFFWLLWGDFCLTMMDNGVASAVVNQQLKTLGVSNSTIGFLNGTVMALMSVLLVSVISTTSDRTRTRLGRRMPYLLWATPPLALFLILIGISPRIAAKLQTSWPGLASKLTWLARHLLPKEVGALPAHIALIVAVMSALLIVYKLFDLFPQSVYYYLWADVIPAKLMGTFACLFRVVAAVGMFLFNRFVLKFADTHPEEIYVGAGLLYLFAFVAMSLIVKEGQYPPPPPRQGNSIGTYLRESFTHSYYWKYYVMTGCFIVAVKSLNQFIQFFGTAGMGFSLARYGQLISYKDLITILPFLVMGPLVDYFHPLRAGMIAYVFVLAFSMLSFLFIRGEQSFAFFVSGTYVSIAIYQAATGAIGPRLLPRERYGQFSSANAVVWQLSWAAASWLCGRFLDAVIAPDAAGKPTHPENYRYLFLWFFGFCAIGAATTLSVYRHWKALGGDDNYSPPDTSTPTTARGFDVVQPR